MAIGGLYFIYRYLPREVLSRLIDEDAKTKELIGLAVSLALRCDDCVRYHVQRCIEEGASSREMTEAMTIALVVGGSITIPHLRRAFAAVDAFSSA